MTYQEAIDFLYAQLPMFSRVGAAAYKPGLDTSYKLAEFFDNPHLKFKSIHVGGTNGKGSTSHILASVLQAAGYKVGLYTSPHLVDFRERMRINGQMISREEVADFVERWKKSGYDGHPSFFELTMIMAFQWFAKEKVDYAVIEVGMGGRLDSTNIITPELSVITNISFDHYQFLGDTISKISSEKAGIIKRGVPVVIGEHHPQSDPVFIAKAKETRSTLVFAEDLYIVKGLTPGHYMGWRVNSEEGIMNLPLGGEYQKKNIQTAFAAISEMRKLGIPLSSENVKAGIESVEKNTGLRGRWTILNRNPLVIADTGHNIAGMKYNISQLKETLKERQGKLKIVIGFVADKALDEIMGILPEEAEYYVTNTRIPRALPSSELIKKFEGLKLNAREYHKVEDAYSAALKEAKENDIIFVGGSTFVVAEVLEMEELKN